MGMSMFGKISVGVRTIAIGPMKRMRIANTTKVYGRLSAIRTIHTLGAFGQLGGSPYYMCCQGVPHANRWLSEEVAPSIDDGIRQLPAQRDRIDGRGLYETT